MKALLFLGVLLGQSVVGPSVKLPDGGATPAGICYTYAKDGCTWQTLCADGGLTNTWDAGCNPPQPALVIPLNATCTLADGGSC